MKNTLFDPVLPISFVHAMAHTAACYGVPVQKALDDQTFDIESQSTVFSSELDAFALALLPLAPFNTFLQFISEMSFEPFTEILTVLTTGQTARSSMESLMEVGPYNYIGMRLFYSTVAGQDYFICDVQSLPVLQQRFMAEVSLGLTKRFLPQGLLISDLIQEVHFTFSDEGGKQEYEDYFGVPVLFNQPLNQQIFKESFCDNTLPSFSTVLHQKAKESLFNKTEQIIKLQGIKLNVVQCVRNVSFPDVVLIDDIAKHCGMSSRSLQRRLKEEGTTFSELKYRTLIDQSKLLLLKTEQSLEDIAVHFGFSDRASYSKAFKKYEGQWPAQYRRSAVLE